MGRALEVQALRECEAVIERGLATFVEVGEALLRIRDERLYRETHGTFEAYCRERWGMSRPRAYQLMQSAEVGTALSTTVDTPLPGERSARELAPLRHEPEQLREVWAETVERHGEKPTAAQVREVVNGSKPEPEYTHCPTCGHRVRADKPLRPRGGGAR